MDNERFERLTNGGIDVNEALSRLMGSEKLLEKFLDKFCDDKNYAELVQAAQKHDTEEMIRCSHSLKGMCGNLSMTALFELLTRQLAELRAGNTDGAIELMPDISEEYEKVTVAIRNR